MGKLSHFDNEGNARMVDVGAKDESKRIAKAQAVVYLKSSTFEQLNKLKKGDPYQAARIAGIQAAKRTSDLIPLCHPLLLTYIGVDFETDREKSCIRIVSEVHCTGKTGVEMEALTAVSVAALTFYDMCKAVDKEITITDICLLEKSGGRTGYFAR
jgi:cyclic pyranopterin phosphate synthase